MASTDPLDLVLELAELLTPAWAPISAGIPDWHPRNEGDDDEDKDDEKDDDADKDKDADDDDKDDDAGKGEPDWKREARKHERRAKAEKKRADELAAKQQERDDATKSEHEKALDKAREEAKAEALTESQLERRNDRLEVAVTRHAARTFADVDDALLHIKRAIADGDIDADDIFDDKGKVQTEALKTELEDLLERKPHLKADASSGRANGSADAGKGSGGKDVDAMDTDAHLTSVRRHKP